MSAIPSRIQRRRVKKILTGEVANPANPPSGCYFHPRCTYAKEICSVEDPPFEEITPKHYVKCHRARDLSSPGRYQISM